jgi:hypothetical protein
VDQLFNSSAKRLAQVLLLLANFGKGAKPERRFRSLTRRHWRRSWAQPARESAIS